MTDAAPEASDELVLAEEDIAEQKAVRLAKRERLIADGDDAYPVAVPVTHTIPQVRERWENLETDATTGATPASSASPCCSRATATPSRR